MRGWIDSVKAVGGKQWLGFILIFVAGAAFHFAVEDWKKALAIVTGAVIIDIAIDMILLKVEKARGDID